MDIMNDNDAWMAKIEEDRVEKDAWLSKDGQSPIPLMKRKKFKGLEYFTPDAKFTFKLELREHADKIELVVKDSKGNDRKFIAFGEFVFNIDGVDHTLQAYKTDAGEKRLFIPFKDGTSGKESYGAGRYLDLQEETDLSDGKWTLDLNNAYNPWCAYNHNYACPLVPVDNCLNVKIEAGERDYSKS